MHHIAVNVDCGQTAMSAVAARIGNSRRGRRFSFDHQRGQNFFPTVTPYVAGMPAVRTIVSLIRLTLLQ